MTTKFLEPVVGEMAWATSVWFNDHLISVADASPLLLFWAYQSITIYRRLERTYGNEVQQCTLLMMEKLKLMSLRWQAGGNYSLSVSSTTHAHILKWPIYKY